jgi:nuclear pore complex protein Nup85
LRPDPDVLLSAKDTFELLRHVEDIAQSSRYAPESYLSALYRLTSRTSGQGGGKADDKPDYEETMKALDLVRIAGLANLGRTGMDLVRGWS